MKNKLNHLMSNVGRIQKYYKSEYEKSGAKFNVFSITKIERKEVDTHSAMIAELLSPKGSHSQGSIFLRLFFESMTCLKDMDVDFLSARVKKEKSFNRGKDRVDIIVEFDNFILIIENKIDAIDQYEQLKRYDEIARKLNKNYLVIYLTKYGTEATEKSHKNTVVYEPLSYKLDILNWLEVCIKEVALIPQVRELLVQYSNLVKKITGVSLTMNESNEIVEEITKNILVAKAICNNYNKAQVEVIYPFFKSIRDAFSERLVRKEQLSNNTQKYFMLDDNKHVDKSLIENWIYKHGTKKTWEVKPLLIDLENNSEDDSQKRCYCIMLATDYFHEGFIILNKNSNGLYEYTKEKELYGEMTDSGFKLREWNFATFYSKGKEFRNLDENILEFILKPEELIRDIKNQFNDEK